MKYRKWRVKRKRLCSATIWKVGYTPRDGESPFPTEGHIWALHNSKQVRGYSKHELSLDISVCLDRNDLTNTDLKMLQGSYELKEMASETWEILHCQDLKGQIHPQQRGKSLSNQHIWALHNSKPSEKLP